MWPKLFSIEPERSKWTKWVLATATLIVAAIIGCLLTVACASSANSRDKWRATLRITYANGQRITSANAEGIDSGTCGRDSGTQSAGNSPATGDAR